MNTLPFPDRELRPSDTMPSKARTLDFAPFGTDGYAATLKAMPHEIADTVTVRYRGNALFLAALWAYCAGVPAHKLAAEVRAGRTLKKLLADVKTARQLKMYRDMRDLTDALIRQSSPLAARWHAALNALLRMPLPTDAQTLILDALKLNADTPETHAAHRAAQLDMDNQRLREANAELEAECARLRTFMREEVTEPD